MNNKEMNPSTLAALSAGNALTHLATASLTLGPQFLDQPYYDGPHGPRNPSGKDRSKVKAARKQNKNRKKKK